MLSGIIENTKEIFKVEKVTSNTPINCWFIKALESYNTSELCKRNPDIIDIVFCTDGVMVLNRGDSKAVSLMKNELMLLSDCMEVDSINFSKSFEAIIISLNYSDYLEDKVVFKRISDEKAVQQNIKDSNGCIVLKDILWVRSLFENIGKMNIHDKCAYAEFKILELFYLINKKDIIQLNGDHDECKDESLSHLVESIKTYMENHLDEKLTIENMCNKFNISPTLFKTTFRNKYGEPVHSWIQKQRMHLAAKYLCTSSMNVLQIAYEVGFGGTSQFNSLFKRYYGVTPTQYRKLSYTGRISPIQQDK